MLVRALTYSHHEVACMRTLRPKVPHTLALHVYDELQGIVHRRYGTLGRGVMSPRVFDLIQEAIQISCM